MPLLRRALTLLVAITAFASLVLTPVVSAASTWRTARTDARNALMSSVLASSECGHDTAAPAGPQRTDAPAAPADDAPCHELACCHPAPVALHRLTIDVGRAPPVVVQQQQRPGDENWRATALDRLARLPFSTAPPARG